MTTRYCVCIIFMFLGCQTFQNDGQLNKESLENKKMYSSLSEALTVPNQVYRLRWKVYKKDRASFADLSKLQNLQELQLVSDKIIDIPEAIKDLPHLQILSIDYLNLKQFPDWIFDLKNLKGLHSLSNSMNQLSPKIKQLNQLEELSIAGQGYPFFEGDTIIKMNSLPDELSQLTQLKVLRLNSQLFTHIPKVLTKLPSLKEIHITNNGVERILSDLHQLKKLEVLNLSNNKLIDFPEELQNLEQLHTLDLAANSITKIPSSLQRFSQLKTLRLRANPISKEEVKKIRLQNSNIKIDF